ncbi:exosortase B [Amantichitinum ursilacus]|uniref:Transmembrane exosortase n=1 Tax=Amantichitinum ursilacus TaxID=857265 RepID=A0A0N0XHK9_9NEIS|nr:exosortase B [Amantichitinum ursilacus]KPC51820.1 Transmembrane exosortase [Amantichitinum ursilacus]
MDSGSTLPRNLPGEISALLSRLALPLVGLLILLVPTVLRLATTLWDSDEQAHGPIVLLIVLWLFWSRREEVKFSPPSWLGWPLLVVGAVMYALGRSQQVYLFEIGAFIPMLAGLLLVYGGWALLKSYRFALFFILFMIPLPGSVVDMLTGTLKQYVSVLAENALYALGYPIARTGVMLTIGPYELLVADACSGLHSMFSLYAMGLLYLYLAQYKSISRNLLIFLAIAPIAFLANVARVMILVLVTYHFGDAAGQGFIHGFAGIIIFAVALVLLFSLDSLMGLFTLRRKGAAV